MAFQKISRGFDPPFFQLCPLYLSSYCFNMSFQVILHRCLAYQLAFTKHDQLITKNKLIGQFVKHNLRARLVARFGTGFYYNPGLKENTELKSHKHGIQKSCSGTRYFAGFSGNNVLKYVKRHLSCKNQLVKEN